MTLTCTPIAERLAVELALPDLTTLGLSRPRFEHTTFRMQGLLSNQLPNRRDRRSLNNVLVAYILEYHKDA